MKTKSILAALLLIVAGVQTVRAQKQSSAASGKAKVVLYKTNGQTIECEVSELDSIVFVEKQDIIDENHEWVDLGLPSGTLWATCNIGSRSLEEYGDYFAWGETEPKTTYDWGHYKYNQGSGKMTKYCTVENFGINGFTDGLTELLPEDDAATANWGSEWQMPSMAQLEELIDTTFTTAKWTVENGFNGTRITSKLNGNWIFLPASGYCESILLYREGSYGSCWTRSLRKDAPNSALDWGYNWSDIYSGFDRRYIGLNVRPVRVEGVQRVLATAIVLSDLTLNLLQGESKTITATVQPSDAYFPVVRWESSDEMVAKVDGAGLVTAIFPGTCTITCRAADGSGVYAECLVTINKVELQLLPFVEDFHEIQSISSRRRIGIPSGYVAYNPLEAPEIGFFITEDRIMEEGSFIKSEDKWGTYVSINNDRNYQIYGYMPNDDIIGATIMPNVSFANGCIMTLSKLRTITSTDVCFVSGVKQTYGSFFTEDEVQQGTFGYTVMGLDEGNYIYMLFNHLYASIDFQIYMNADYDALRTIKVKSMSLKSNQYSTSTATITMTANDSGLDPVSSIEWAYDSGSCEETVFASNTLDPDTPLIPSTSLKSIGTCMIAPGMNSSGNGLILNTVFDVYDKAGNLIRENCIVENSFNGVFQEVLRGHSYIIKLEVCPTYLYMLNEPDLDNPTFKVVLE